MVSDLKTFIGEGHLLKQNLLFLHNCLFPLFVSHKRWEFILSIWTFQLNFNVL